MFFYPDKDFSEKAKIRKKDEARKIPFSYFSDMKTISLPLVLILQLATWTACSQSGSVKKWQGEYSGKVEGESLVLTLLESSPTTVTGSLYDGYQTFSLEAQTAEKLLTGTLSSEAAQVTLPMRGTLTETGIDIELDVNGTTVSASLSKGISLEPSTSTAPSPSGTERDPKVVGTWEYQENRSDPFGGSTFSQRMVLFGDGSVGDGGSDAGFSGSGGSAMSGDRSVAKIPNVSWYTSNRNLYFSGTENGQTQTEKLGRYHIEQGAMLITTDNGQKVLFYKK